MGFIFVTGTTNFDEGAEVDFGLGTMSLDVGDRRLPVGDLTTSFDVGVRRAGGVTVSFAGGFLFPAP